jgi:putative colanic acid biosynthesis UDP-glucose lipid carrier transferase
VTCLLIPLRGNDKANGLFGFKFDFFGGMVVTGSSSGLIRQHSSGLAMLMRTLDAMIVVSGMYFSAIVYGLALNADYLLLITLAVLIFLFVSEVRGLYKSWRAGSVIEECKHVAVVWFIVLLLLMALGFLTKTSAEFSRAALAIWTLVVPCAMFMMRCVLRWMLHQTRLQGRNTRTVALAGVGESAVKMTEHIAQMPWAGLKLIGAFDDRMEQRLDKGSFALQGNLQQLLEMAKAGQIDIVYITMPMKAERRIIQLIEELSDSTAAVYIVPDLFVFSLYKARWVTMGGMPVISTFESPFFGIESWLKRAEDLLIGGCILLLVAPLLLLIAAGVKLTSKGPVIFKQHRYGLKGEVVEVWKFRSMTVCDNGSRMVQACKNDARVTRFGAFLRRTSLDELPQFINVLQGTMSIVGPRPHAVAHNEQYRKLIRGYMLRHKVKPGITGLAQVSGWRGETDTLEKMQKRVEHDLEYIQNWSLWLDIRIILRTVVVGFVGKNVY